MQPKLADISLSFLPDDVLGRLASSFDISPAATALAVHAMVPGLLSAIAAKASTPAGADAIIDALDSHDLTELGKVVAMIGGPVSDDHAGVGKALAGQLLEPPAHDALVAAVAKAAGIDPAQSGRLLSLLTPIVAGTLIRQQQDGALDAKGLARLLAPLVPSPPTSIPAIPASTLTSRLAVAGLATQSGDGVAVKPLPAPPPEPIAPIPDGAATGHPAVAPSTIAIPEILKTPKRDRPAFAVPARRPPSVYAHPSADSAFAPSAEASVDAAPLRLPGHHLARFGWLIPLAFLAVGGAWWLNVLYNTHERVVAGEPAPAVAASHRPISDGDAAPGRAAARPAAPPDAPSAHAAAAHASPSGTAPAMTPPLTNTPASETAAVDDAARKAALDAELARQAAVSAAAQRAAADAELARRAELDAAATRAARDAEIARRPEPDRQPASATASATRSSRGASTGSPAPVVTATEAQGRCVSAITRASEANRVHFEFASARMTRASLPVLRQLATEIKSCPTVHIRIEGHTDSDGHWARNQRLSERRARAVAAFLTRDGIDRARLTATGYGQTRPRVPNTSAANKQLNRRIEFVVPAS